MTDGGNLFEKPVLRLGKGMTPDDSVSLGPSRLIGGSVTADGGIAPSAT